MFNKLIKDILKETPSSQEVEIRGWVKTRREMKNLVFIEVSDGSCMTGIQCIFENNAGLCAAATGASVIIKGKLVPSPASGQAVEIAAEKISVLGEAQSFPLQKKYHSMEFLREIAHLRPRTNTFGAVARVRAKTAFLIHRYFNENGFFYIHTPIITAEDAEGAGAMFQVTTLDLNALAAGSNSLVDYSKDFFGEKTFLTVSGQLEAEAYAQALSRVYTFGPTFRAENSNTTRHLAEFWMLEPEIAFADLNDNMAIAEDFLKFIFKNILEDCNEELSFFDKHLEKGIIETLTQVANSKFAHITYTNAILELEKAVKNGVDFEFMPKWGCDLQSEHEKFLTEKLTKGPLIVTDYPKDIKAFYMKQNDDGKTVRAMDVLVPRLGEIIGGSQREDDLEKLGRRMAELGMKTEDYQWYLDLRRYGSVPHSGFGLGFERLVQYTTGMVNIRDVIPFPRTVGQADF